jgi:hypothetical protein
MQQDQKPHHQQYSRSHVSMGSVKYAAGAVIMAMLSERIKTPEQRYLALAAIAAVLGAVETAWRDRIKAERDTLREEKRART